MLRYKPTVTNMAAVRIFEVISYTIFNVLSAVSYCCKHVYLSVILLSYVSSVIGDMKFKSAKLGWVPAT
jgi:hypothetical protein